MLGTLGSVNTRVINRMLFPRGRLEGVNAGCEEPDDDHRKRGIPFLLSLGAVDPTVNASVSQCHGRDDGRRSSAPGRGVMTSTTGVAIALKGAGLGP